MQLCVLTFAKNSELQQAISKPIVQPYMTLYEMTTSPAYVASIHGQVYIKIDQACAAPTGLT